MLTVRVLNRFNTILGRINNANTLFKCKVVDCRTQNLIPIAKFSSAATDDKNEKSSVRNIYEGQLNPHIVRVKAFSLFTSVIGVGCQPIVYPQIVEMQSVPAFAAFYTVIGFFTLGTPIIMHHITKKYIFSIDYDAGNDSYTAITRSFFLRRKVLNFKVEDVAVPDIPGMFCSFVIKGQPLFADVKRFKEPKHYAKMMGYDKPMNFHMINNEETKNAKE